MNTTIKFISLAASLAVALTACGAAAGGGDKTATVTRGPISQVIEDTGTIAAGSEAKLSFQQSGVVREVSVSIGDVVTKGAVLAALDTADLELGLRQAEAQLAQAKNNIRNAEQAILVAQANYSRTVEGAREADLKAAEAALSSAKANYAKATTGQSSDAAAAKAALEAAQANLDKVRIGPTVEDMAGVRAALQNAEAALKQAQSAYDRANGRNPAAIGASPEALQLEQATNAYALSKSNYDKVAKGADDAQLRAAEQQLATAKANYARFYGSNYAASKSAAEQQIASAQASLDKLKQPARDFDIAQLTAQIEQARIALDNAKVTASLNEIALAQATRRLDQAVLRAPFDGVIGSVNVRAGESVSTAGAPTSAFVIADTRGYYMDVTVDELNVSSLRTGQRVSVKVDALPGAEVAGTVARIASTSNKVNGVVNYVVRVALDGNTDGLKSGMSATAYIVLERKDSAILAPSAAVRRDGATGKAFLTTRTGNQTQDVEVRTGLRDSSNIEIVSGVQEGAMIVLP